MLISVTPQTMNIQSSSDCLMFVQARISKQARDLQEEMKAAMTVIEEQQQATS